MWSALQRCGRHVVVCQHQHPFVKFRLFDSVHTVPSIWFRPSNSIQPILSDWLCPIDFFWPTPFVRRRCLLPFILINRSYSSNCMCCVHTYPIPYYSNCMLC
jgi:hypothetical protein